MYFSERNEDTVFINHYSGLLEIEGTGDLTVEDLEISPSEEEGWGKEYTELSVKEGITEIREGFLNAFPNMKSLILSRTVTNVALTPELTEMLRKNRVLIRGEYDTCAEEFAKKLDLKFLHCDIPICEDEDEHERDVITLRFNPGGTPEIHHNIFTSGSSAGNYGGGEVSSELPENFFAGCTIDTFAEKFPERIRGRLLENVMLRRFLDIANCRLGKKKGSSMSR